MASWGSAPALNKSVKIRLPKISRVSGGLRIVFRQQVGQNPAKSVNLYQIPSKHFFMMVSLLPNNYSVKIRFCMGGLAAQGGGRPPQALDLDVGPQQAYPTR